MLLARERRYTSPTNLPSDEHRSSLMTPPHLSPRRMGSDSVTNRTLMVSRNLSPSLLLPMDLEQADNRSFQRSLFALKPRNGTSSSSDQTTATEPAPRLPLQTAQTSRAVLVTPRCQPLNKRKRQRTDESDNEEEDEELRNLNVPKKLVLCLDD